MRSVCVSVGRSVAIIIKAIDIFLLSCAPAARPPAPEPGGVPLRVPFPPERERKKEREPTFGF